MIKAKVTVYDDETGKVYEKDRVIGPYKEEAIDLDKVLLGSYIISSEFRFEIRRREYVHNCLSCKHFSCNKPTPYSDNQVIIKDHCTLHPDEEDAYGYCDDYERGI